MCVLVKQLRKGKRKNGAGITRLLSLQRKIVIQIRFSEMVGLN